MDMSSRPAIRQRPDGTERPVRVTEGTAERSAQSSGFDQPKSPTNGLRAPIFTFEQASLDMHRHQDTNTAYSGPNGLAPTSEVPEEHFEPLVEHEAAYAEEETTGAASNDPEEEAFKPIDPPPGYPELDFIPTMLKPASTIAVAIFYACCVIGVCFIHFATESHRTNEIRDVNVYMLARFGPPVVATIATTLFKTVINEFFRILPYLNMADRGTRETASLPGRVSFGAVYWPVDWFKNSVASWSRFYINIILATMVNLGKGLVLQIVNQDKHWTIIIHGTWALVLAAYFLIAMMVMLWLTWWLWSRQTGLRQDWNPQSLADMLSLFRWCNFDAGPSRNGDTRYYPDLRAEAACHIFRIGYWERSAAEGTEVVYGIRSLRSSPFTCSYPREQRLYRKRRSGREYPYLCNPFDSTWHKTYTMLATLLLAFFLTFWALGFIRYGFVMDRHWKTVRLDQFDGNATELHADITLTGQYNWVDFRTPGASHLLLVAFVLRGLPVSLLAFTLSYTMQLDVYHRFLQPFYNMVQGPCEADDSILLDYLTTNPAEVIPQAFSNSHWKVLWYSIFEALRPFLAILPWGVMTLKDTGTYYVCQFSQSLFWASITILTVFLGSCLLAWPSDKRRIPRRHTSLLDIWAMCSGSRLSQYPEFANVWTKKDLVATIHLRHDKYALGVLRGDDGINRLGLDVFSSGKEEVETHFVEHVEPRNLFRLRKKKQVSDEMEMQVTS